ncbi:MAG: hypothetical protein GXP32_04780, partial [Kiritimatiellaeota bacterium]|nr:hypothetical protein [Kiritimatiellota bacterium]
AMPPRDSSRAASWIVERLREWGLTVSDVDFWTCGTGPGSFTALRSVAALTAGFATAKGRAAARGVPSALAIAAEIAESRSKAVEIAVLYDGRRGEVLALPVHRGPKGFTISGDSAIFAVSRDDFTALFDFDVLAATRRETAAIESVLPKELFEKVAFIDSFPVERLLEIDDPKWDFDTLLNPIYLRSATHVAPVVPRNL